MSNRFEQKLMLLTGIIQECNDRLGMYSDHEGQRDGSTFFFWTEGRAAFDRQCERAVEDHRAAIRAWRKIQRFNRDHPEIMRGIANE